jgi:glycosyltransferase involved in cell wall biosynthesis
MLKVAIFGSFTPPYGGISVHIERLSKSLAANNIDFTIFSMRSHPDQPHFVKTITKLRFLILLCSKEYTIKHLYFVNWYSRVIFAAVSIFFPGQFIISIHGGSISEALFSQNKLKSLLTKWMLRSVDTVIACNNQINKICINYVGLLQKKVKMIPAFIPPNKEDIEKIDPLFNSFLTNHGPIISAVGWVGIKHKNEDLYGLDLLIDCTYKLKNKFSDIGLLISINGGEKKQISDFITYSNAKLGTNIYLLLNDESNINSLYIKSDIFIRPTNTDGDSVSIREALFFKTPVIASDTVKRPSSCIIFKNRDKSELYSKILYVLKNKSIVIQNHDSADYTDNSISILKLYQES